MGPSQPSICVTMLKKKLDGSAMGRLVLGEVLLVDVDCQKVFLGNITGSIAQ